MLTQTEQAKLYNDWATAELDKALLALKIEDQAAEIARLKATTPAAFVGVQTNEEMAIRRVAPIQQQTVEPRAHFHLTTDQMRALIFNRPHGRIEAALLKLESMQTYGERAMGETLAKNGRGFSKKHYTAGMKSMIAWIRGTGNRWEINRDTGKNVKLRLSLLTGMWAPKAANIIHSYCRQLAEVANEEGNASWLNIEA